MGEFIPWLALTVGLNLNQNQLKKNVKLIWLIVMYSQPIMKWV